MNTEIYCDGSADNNGTRKGSFGVIVIQNNTILHVHREAEEDTTNNIMELKALIYALYMAEKYNNSVIYTDSAYACNAFNDWIPNSWSKHDWKNSKNKVVENLELMKELYRIQNSTFVFPSVQKVKGHADNIGNCLADRIAAGDRKGIAKLIQDNHLTIALC